MTENLEVIIRECQAVALEEAAEWVMGPSDYLMDGGTCRHIAGYLRQRAQDLSRP